MIIRADGTTVSNAILGLGLSAFICVYLRTRAFCLHHSLPQAAFESDSARAKAGDLPGKVRGMVDIPDREVGPLPGLQRAAVVQAERRCRVTCRAGERFLGREAKQRA